MTMTNLYLIKIGYNSYFNFFIFFILGTVAIVCADNLSHPTQLPMWVGGQ